MSEQESGRRRVQAEALVKPAALNTVRPRGKGGRFLQSLCPDQNCGGRLMPEDGHWRCDGLTYKDDNDPLEACMRWEEGP